MKNQQSTPSPWASRNQFEVLTKTDDNDPYSEELSLITNNDYEALEEGGLRKIDPDKSEKISFGKGSAKRSRSMIKQLLQKGSMDYAESLFIFAEHNDALLFSQKIGSVGFAEPEEGRAIVVVPPLVDIEGAQHQYGVRLTKGEYESLQQESYVAPKEKIRKKPSEKFNDVTKIQRQFDDTVQALIDFIMERIIKGKDASLTPDTMSKLQYLLSRVLFIGSIAAGILSGEPYIMPGFGFPEKTKWFGDNEAVNALIGTLLASGGAVSNAALNSFFILALAEMAAPSRTEQEEKIRSRLRGPYGRVVQVIEMVFAVAASAGFSYFTYKQSGISIWLLDTILVLFVLNKVGLKGPLTYLIRFFETIDYSPARIQREELKAVFIRHMKEQLDKLLRLDQKALEVTLLNKLTEIHHIAKEQHKQVFKEVVDEADEEQNDNRDDYIKRRAPWVEFLTAINEISKESGFDAKLEKARRSDPHMALKRKLAQVAGVLVCNSSLLGLSGETYHSAQDIKDNKAFDVGFLILSLIPLVGLSTYAGSKAFGDVFDFISDYRKGISRNSVASRAFGKKILLAFGPAIGATLCSWAGSAYLGFTNYTGPMKYVATASGIMGALLFNAFGTTSMASSLAEYAAINYGPEYLKSIANLEDFVKLFIEFLSQLPAHDVVKFFHAIPEHYKPIFLKWVSLNNVVPMLVECSVDVRDKYFELYGAEAREDFPDNKDTYETFLSQIPARYILTALNMVPPKYIESTLLARKNVLKHIPEDIGRMELNRMSEQHVMAVINLNQTLQPILQAFLGRFQLQHVGEFLACVPLDRKDEISTFFSKKPEGTIATAFWYVPRLAGSCVQKAKDALSLAQEETDTTLHTVSTTTPALVV